MTAKQQYSSVAHNWAHQNSNYEEAYGKRMYFDGDTIYSYGSHFPIAKLVKTKKGTLVLFTRKTNSNTTNQHIQITRNAIPSYYQIIEINNLHARSPMDKADNINELTDTIAELVGKEKRSRTVSYIKEIQTLLVSLHRYVAFLGKKSVYENKEVKRIGFVRDVTRASEEVLRSQDFMDTKVLKFAANLAKADKMFASSKAKRERKALEKKVTDWKAGLNWNNSLTSERLDTTLLRVKSYKDKTVVETSRGVTVELEEAKKLYLVLSVAKNTGKSISFDPPYEIARFKAQAFTSDGTLHAGCHVIKWEEISEVAKTLNW